MVQKKGGLFIMPRSSRDWSGSEALWITVSGWARAAQKLFPDTIVATTDRMASPDEILDYPLGEVANKQNKEKYPLIPNVLKTLVKDYLLYLKSTKKSNYAQLKTNNSYSPSFIWEQHDIFEGPGFDLANKYNVPLIKYVHAPQVWEAKKWGVNRPLYGKWLEYRESKNLNKADVVACVSDEVAKKLIDMGVLKNKILISPMAVDSQLFTSTQNNELRKKLNLENKIVLGWTGSFRSFHGLEFLVEAFHIAYKKNNLLHLVLVGDGYEKHKIQKLVLKLGLEDEVSFLGRKKFRDIPKYVSLFDIAIVSAKTSEGFHYSPLKLREYLAAKKATLAPNAGEIPDRFEDGKHLLLYNVADVKDMSEKILILSNVEDERESIANEGFHFINDNGTWDVELEKCFKRIF